MKNILIADDSASFRHQLSTDLSEAGFNIIEAEDGQIAIEKITAEQDLSLVILDVNMPRASGMEVLEAIKDLPHRDNFLVLMLTTDSSPELKAKGKELGVKAWITKPYNKASLTMAVKKVTGQ